jgi:hypothetical protein
MSEKSEAERFAEHLVSTLGPGEALVTAMRLVLLVGQRTPNDERVIDAAKEAFDAIHKIAVLAGYVSPPPAGSE